MKRARAPPRRARASSAPPRHERRRRPTIPSWSLWALSPAGGYVCLYSSALASLLCVLYFSDGGGGVAPAGGNVSSSRPSTATSSIRGGTSPRLLAVPPPMNTNLTPSRYAGGGEGGRFPVRTVGEAGEDFTRTCGWTLQAPPGTPRGPSIGNNCTILVRPAPGGNDGISEWTSAVANGYVLARQTGCRFLLDYGLGVDVRSVLEPLFVDGGAPVGTGPGEGLYDWTVPDGEGSECRKEDRCFLAGVETARSEPTPTELVRTQLGGLLFRNASSSALAPIVDAPPYRYALLDHKANGFVNVLAPPGKSTTKKKACRTCLYDDAADDLRRNLPGFRTATGFACAMSNLFRPAFPAAADYEPRLFTEILPVLRDPHALVLGVYVRTGLTDAMATDEERRRKGEKKNVAAAATAEAKISLSAKNSADDGIFECAASVEERYLTGKVDKVRLRGSGYSKVVWMVVTDSPPVKAWAVSNYAGPSSVASYERTVLVTSSRGTHTRTRRGPSTADFAGGMLDWYLLGEADVLVEGAATLTFGNTAAFRTARPLYTAQDKCSRATMIHERGQLGQKPRPVKGTSKVTYAMN